MHRHGVYRQAKLGRSTLDPVVSALVTSGLPGCATPAAARAATQEMQAASMKRRIRLPALLTLTVLVTGIPAAGFAVTASPPAGGRRPVRPPRSVSSPAGVAQGRAGPLHPGPARPDRRRTRRLLRRAELPWPGPGCLPAPGDRLPAARGHRPGARGDIVLASAIPGARSHRAEGYQLGTAASGARIEAPTAHGLYDGVQTFRQLLPAWISSPTVRRGPWTTPAVAITDYPRYSYRGVMLDIARHFEPPSAVRSSSARSPRTRSMCSTCTSATTRASGWPSGASPG